MSRLSDFAGAIDLSADDLPPGVTASFAPATVPGNEVLSTFTLSASGTAALDTVIIGVRAKVTGVTEALAALEATVNP